jgi:hypothetical protein
MNIAPTSVAMPKQRISHWRVLSGKFLLRRLRMTDALRFLLIATCRMNEPITSDSRGLVGQNCQAQAIVIAGLRITYFSLRLLKLRLTQFNN